MTILAHAPFSPGKSPCDSRRPRSLTSPNVPDLSFVIPAYNEEGNIATIIAEITEEAKRLVLSFDILIVDDGSLDGTFAEAKAMCAKFPVRVIRLSRNFGKEQAIMAGLERATGLAVVVLDADLQEPLSHLETMLAHYRDGYEMVYAVRAHRHDELYLKRVLTSLFYRLVSYGSDVFIPPNARDFRLMDRAVVNALCALPERNRFMKGLYGWIGFRSKAIPIILEERENGASKFGWKGLICLG